MPLCSTAGLGTVVRRIREPASRAGEPDARCCFFLGHRGEDAEGVVKVGHLVTWTRPARAGRSRRQFVARRLPGGVPGVELGAEVGPGEPLDHGHPGRALVRGLGDVVSGDTAEAVLRVEQREQGLGARGEDVGVCVPVRAHDRQEGGGVLVAGDHERGCRHAGEVRGREEGPVLRDVRGEGVASPSGRGEQHARPDPGLGQVHFRPVVRVGEPGAQQQARGVPAHRMPDHCDPAPVQAPGELRDGGLDLVEPVEDARHVLGA